jgi:hypothetical protein
MTLIKRSRRLQAGLAGLSVLSALGAAVGLGLTAHTGGGDQDTPTGSAGAGKETGARKETAANKESSTGSTSTTSRTSSSRTHRTSPVTPSASPTTQATTSGS